MEELSGLENDDFDHLYDRYSDRIYRLSLGSLRNEADAEDVVQDVFLAYLFNKKAFVDEQHQEAWLIRVTINKCRDCLRKKKVREALPLDDLYNFGVCDQDHDVLASVISLPDKIRLPMLLYYFEGYTVKETAHLLHLSVSAVKMRLSRGRNTLKEILEGGCWDEWEAGESQACLFQD